ncbi:MAG: bifunctional riboflavin kinase/FAD synthetase [Anaerotignaceae bacterium]
MEHITTQNIDQQVNTAVTLGNFDGVHLGHRSLINITKEQAKANNLKAVVFTFYPHPMFVFSDKKLNVIIMSAEEKKLTMESLGIDLYIEYPFTNEFAAMSAEDFAVKLIFERMKAKVVVTGENFKFGYKNQGDGKLLKKLGEERGIKVILVPAVTYENERVSSTRIREALVNKNVELANRLLTVPDFIYGEVVKGKQLGRTIGFPTINVIPDPDKLFPPNGVYATVSLHDGQYYYGVTNVGINPTVHGTKKIVETFLFDFKKVIYGEYIKTHLFHFIRPEQKFPSVEVLQAQLKKDRESAKEYFQTQEFSYWKTSLDLF